MVEVLAYESHRRDKGICLDLIQVHYVLLYLLYVVSESVLGAGRVCVSCHDGELLNLLDRQPLKRGAITGFHQTSLVAFC